MIKCKIKPQPNTIIYTHGFKLSFEDAFCKSSFDLRISKFLQNSVKNKAESELKYLFARKSKLSYFFIFKLNLIFVSFGKFLDSLKIASQSQKLTNYLESLSKSFYQTKMLLTGCFLHFTLLQLETEVD